MTGLCAKRHEANLLVYVALYCLHSCLVQNTVQIGHLNNDPLHYRSGRDTVFLFENYRTRYEFR